MMDAVVASIRSSPLRSHRVENDSLAEIEPTTYVELGPRVAQNKLHKLLK